MTQQPPAEGTSPTKKRFPHGNPSSFDPNFSAVVVQDKNRIAQEVEVQHRLRLIGQDEIQACRPVVDLRFHVTTHLHLLYPHRLMSPRGKSICSRPSAGSKSKFTLL